MNNILKLICSILIVALPFSVIAGANSDSKVSDRGRYPQVKSHLCDTFAEYAVIAKDLASGNDVSKDDLVMMSSRFIVQSDAFLHLTKDKKDAWLEFVADAAIWAHNNLSNDDFYNKAKARCSNQAALADAIMKERVMSCQALGDLVLAIEPLHLLTRDKSLTIEILQEKMDLTVDKRRLAQDAVNAIDRELSLGSSNIAVEVYRKCMTK